MADGFNHRVEAIVACIPRGRATTYGAIARALGSPRAARVVGGVLSRTNNPDLPCYRVVDRDGRLSGGWAFGHPEVMRALLADEGAPFLPDGRVDLARCFWDPAGD